MLDWDVLLDQPGKITRLILFKLTSVSTNKKPRKIVLARSDLAFDINRVRLVVKQIEIVLRTIFYSISILLSLPRGCTEKKYKIKEKQKRETH